MNGKSLIIVEDDSILRTNLTELLSPHFDSISACSRVASAYIILEKNQFDVALIDRVLPDGSGLEIVSYLHDSSLQTKVMLISYLANPEQKSQGLERGALDYLSKPVHPSELLLKLKQYTFLHRMPEDSVIRTATCQLDMLTGKLSMLGQTYKLRKKEAALLAILMRDPAKVVTRETLVKTIWGHAKPPQATTIDVYLRRVRAKLGHHITCIDTIRGYGYRFSEPVVS